MTNPATNLPHDKNRPAALVLADGTVFYGVAAGYSGQRAGELCFNTSMTGYQEILTDPSYADQIVNFTFPHIGIVGCNRDDNETDDARQTPLVAGAIFREMPDDDGNFSNWRGSDKGRGQGGLRQWLEKNHIPAIAGIDTRALTKKIRDGGAMMAIITSDPKDLKDIEKLKAKAKQCPPMDNQELAGGASRATMAEWADGVYRLPAQESMQEEKAAQKIDGLVVVYDYGVKNNILRLLADMFSRVQVVPARTPAADVLAMNPAGVVLSNGPGDPAATATYAVPIIKDLLAVGDLPIFGICLGHQLLALALGGKTKKMTLGHRGANHPVKDIAGNRVLITSQNHGFVVDDLNLPSGVVVTHR